MYGIMPRAKIENLESAPPENILNIPSTLLSWESNNSFKVIGSIPGTGTCAPILYTINANNRNHKRRLRSANLSTGLTVVPFIANLYPYTSMLQSRH